MLKQLLHQIKKTYVFFHFKIKYPFVARKNNIKLSSSKLTYNQVLSNLYSPNTYFSEFGQDLYLSTLLLNYIRNHPNAWVVDVGAGDPEYQSNSYYFEMFYGCRTLAIDGVEEYSDSWNQIRPSATFVTSVLGAKKGSEEMMVSTKMDKMLSCVSSCFKENKDKGFSKRKVHMRTLANIVDEYDIKEIMLLSIDVAGFEYEVLKGIEFYNSNIKSIVIENITKSYIGREDIRLYLKQRNYVFTARLNNNDDVFVHQSMINGLPQWTHQPVTTI
jgi:FkbM family methyltransferase